MQSLISPWQRWKPVLLDWKGRCADLVFPPECTACQRALQRQSPCMWCKDCLQELVSDPERCCPRCGAEHQVLRLREGQCRLCYHEPFRFSRAVAIGNYRGRLQQMLVQLKASLNDVQAIQFGRLLGQIVVERLAGLEFHGIIPVPSHWWTKMVRPLQLSRVLAEGVSEQTGFPVFENHLQCVRRTAKQGTLSGKARIQNVQGAFAVRRPSRLENPRWLVVDDVMTSGATANQVTNVLKRAGATEVIVATIARGARQS